MQSPIHARYLPKDTESQSPFSSVTVLRVTDNASFLACQIPETKTIDPNGDTVTTPLAAAIIPTAGVSISRILNHPNIVSLVDIVQAASIPGNVMPGEYGNLTVWEDMDAGCLSRLVPSPNALPDLTDSEGWRKLAAENLQRFSLPESLCWHVLSSISRALLWLHYGVKETEGIQGDTMKHDDDWQPILIRDVSPGQIWFKKPKAGETYGECKLGGFQWAKVTGLVGGTMAITTRVEDAPREKQWYWAPVRFGSSLRYSNETNADTAKEIYNSTHSWSRPNEIWSLGAVVYTMMTGMPPPRGYAHNWQISRMNDKGFSKGLRYLVARMLDSSIGNRPDALRLVDEVEAGWRSWRANTAEGRAYVDGGDKAISRMYETGKGRGLSSWRFL